MCGIVGYLGKQNAAPILIGGLRRLEYRGYDSAGLVVIGPKGEMARERAVGRIDALAEKIKNKNIVGTMGIAHCLHPHTVIQLSNGRTLWIKDIQHGAEVINLDTQSRKIRVGKTRIFSHLAPSHLYNVRTPLGNFVATAEHKTLVYSNGSVIEKAVCDLKVGDKLPVPNFIRITKSKSLLFQSIQTKRYYCLTHSGANLMKASIQSVGRSSVAAGSGLSLSYVDHFMKNDRNFREDCLQGLCNYFRWNWQQRQSALCQPIDTIHGKFVSFPLKSNVKVMQIIGYILGDGHVGSRCLRFKDMDRNVLQVYKHLIQEEFGILGRIGTMTDTAALLLECNSFYLCEWLRQNIVSRKDILTSSIGSLPDDQLAGIMRGLYDAEGYAAAQSRQLGFGMNNEFLVRSVQLWLLRFGIISSFIVYPPNKKQKRINPSFKLLISNKASLEAFQRHIGFSSTRKQIILQDIIRRVGKLKFSFREISPASNFIISRVLSVKRIKSDTPIVYDLEVVGHPNFLANGIFTHNSRWATHGQVTEENAHPHFSGNGKIALVHNGIIENYRELKTGILANHQFTSETDSEVLAHLIEHFYAGNLRLAVEKALSLVVGTYGIAAVSVAEPQKIVCARRGSPLVLGIADDAFFIASDASPLLPYTKRVVYLDDGEILEITPDKFQIFNLSDEQIHKTTEQIEWTEAQAQKQGFPHFMLKEIFDQPQVFQDAVAGRLVPQEGAAHLGGLNLSEEELRQIERIIIIACGTAYYASLVGKYVIEHCTGLPVSVEIASEFRYRDPVILPRTLVLAVSQSGETADTLAAMREAKHKGAIVMGIVNAVGSTIAREAGRGVYIHAGPELAVASTKAFTNQTAILVLLGLQLGRQRRISLAKGQQIIEEIKQIPAKMKKILQQSEEIKKIADKYQNYEHMFFLGRGINYPVAMEGALKLKEISYIHAEGYPAGEMKHGPIALIDEKCPVFGIMTKDSLYEKTRSNIEEIRARKGRVILLATEGDEDARRLAEDVIFVPATMEMLEPFLNVLPLQLFAYHMAVLRGKDVDRPRNLAKSVTVE